MKVTTPAMLLPVLLWLSLAGCASPDQRSGSSQDRGVADAATALERQTDADSLAAAALLLGPLSRPEKTLDLLALATRAAADRPDLAWLHIQACARAPGCDATAEKEHLRTLDPANGAASLDSLPALAQSDHVDLYWTTLIVHLTRPAIATGYLPPRQALIEMIGVISIEAVPAYRSVSESCAGTALDDPATLDNCRAVAMALERGDTVITELEGAAIAQRLWPKDSSEWVAASHVRQLYEYRAAQLRQSGRGDFADDRTADEFLALCARSRREQDVEIAELVAAGKNPMPPPSWTP
jgi:hypothetical protein